MASCLNIKLIAGVLLCSLRLAAVSSWNDTLHLRVTTVLPGPFEGVTDFTADPLGNVYILSEKELLEKFDAAGNKKTQFSQNRLGAATSVLAGNALKLLVWYPDFRMVLFLDRSLTQTGGGLNLLDAGFPETRTIGLSADGNIWLYDEVAFKMKKIATDGALIYESQRLNSLFGDRINVQQIMDDGVHVVASDSTLGFFIFDVFGQFQRQISVESPVTQFFLENGTLRWMDVQGRLHVLQTDIPGSGKTWEFPANMAGNEKIKLIPGGIITLRNGVVNVLEGVPGK